jgi:hypothetical protein
LNVLLQLANKLGLKMLGGVGYWWERDHYEDQDVGGWITLGCILERWDGVMWTGLVWLRIGTGGELL